MDELAIDFTQGAVRHRLNQREGRRQDIAKAVGFKAGFIPKIVDATAGLGRDAFLLASLGAEVTLIERNEKLHLLLSQAMDKARDESADFAAIINRMTLLHGNSIELLPGLRPDVVYIDPMHPERKKSALVKKEMRMIRNLVGDDPDSTALIKTALEHAKNRVVVKWPAKADLAEGIVAPSHQFQGKSTRYDVFMTLKQD